MRVVSWLVLMVHRVEVRSLTASMVAEGRCIVSPLALACLQDGAGGEGSLGRTGRRCDADSAVVRQNRGRDVKCDHSTVNNNSMKCVYLDQTLKTFQIFWLCRNTFSWEKINV